jgi:hypothetical protein
MGDDKLLFQEQYGERLCKMGKLGNKITVTSGQEEIDIHQSHQGM